MSTNDEPPLYTGGRVLSTHTVKTSQLVSTEDKNIRRLTTGDVVLDIQLDEDLPTGTVFQLESIGSLITGIKLGNTWLFRKTDAELAEHRKRIADLAKRRAEEHLAENEAEWARREAALPDWIRKRIEGFHAAGGPHFKVTGWGYELIVAELAELYLELGLDNLRDADAFSVVGSEAIRDYAKREGTTGNQHSMALALARKRLLDPDYDFSGTVSALYPITGDPDYSNGGKGR